MSAFITHRQYWAEVVDLMHSVIHETQINDGFSESDWHRAEEICWELTGNHEWIIYTYKSQCVMLHTDNAHAYFDNLGPVTIDNPSDFFLKVAGYALYSDVWDMLCRYMAALENAA
jgi:hypothetical protein